MKKEIRHYFEMMSTLYFWPSYCGRWTKVTLGGVIIGLITVPLYLAGFLLWKIWSIEVWPFNKN